MKKTKTLHELGEEYEQSACQLKKIIAEERKKLRALPDCICSAQAYELKRELNVLYAQQREARELAAYLKTYYEPHNGCRELFRYK